MNFDTKNIKFEFRIDQEAASYKYYLRVKL